MSTVESAAVAFEPWFVWALGHSREDLPSAVKLGEDGKLGKERERGGPMPQEPLASFGNRKRP